jgi:hypothetical protein
VVGQNIVDIGQILLRSLQRRVQRRMDIASLGRGCQRQAIEAAGGTFVVEPTLEFRHRDQRRDVGPIRSNERVERRCFGG